ncbi:MAG: hypothetical protein K6A44_01640 [bacterium]|nr:hypothetical protein [bacterium]
MNKIEIENKLNELRNCEMVEIITDDQYIRTVYYYSIINDEKNERLIFDINTPVSYTYGQIKSIQPSPLERDIS